MLDTPSIGIQQSLDEIIRMAQVVDTMLDQLREAIGEEHIDKARNAKIFQCEETLDIQQKEVTEFLSKLLSGHVPLEVTTEGRQQLRIADEIESISDYITNLLKLHLKLHGEHMALSEKGQKDLEDLHDRVTEYVRFVQRHLRHPSADILARARSDGEAVTHLMKDCRERHLERVADQGVSPLKSLIFTDMLTAYRKIGDHAYNIAEALGGEK
jgi:phosphate:Na+ symporter